VTARLPIEYVVPLRWSGDQDLGNVTGYLQDLSRIVDITVVDGSDEPLFGRHAAARRPFARHMPVRDWPGRNRKVAGVVTGVFAARYEHVVVAEGRPVRPAAVGGHGFRAANGRHRAAAERLPPAGTARALGHRAVTVWLAVGSWPRGDARYRGSRLPVAATHPRPPRLTVVR
jgi:hypothetical protein